MHHLGTYGRRFGLYIVARPGTIMRVVLLEISEEQRAAYMAAMTALWENYMTPFEEVATIPAAFRNYDLGYIDTFRNLQFAVAFRNGLRETIREGGPLPDSRHMLPLLVSIWNKLKGGTDQHSRAMEDLHGRWENALSPTARLTVRTIKTVFYQAKTAFCLMRVCTSLQQGKIKTYRDYLRKLNQVITLRGFMGKCTNRLDHIGLRHGSIQTHSSAAAAAPPAIVASVGEAASASNDPGKIVITNKKKEAFTNEPSLRKLRLKQPGKHVRVEVNKEACPEKYRKKQTCCAVCCRRCTTVDGAVIHREDYHEGAHPKKREQYGHKLGKGRAGHKTRHLCVTCGYVPLCWNTIRFPGDGAVSCWDAWHSEVNLMTGATSETYCHIKCPEEELDLGDLASPAASAKPTKNKGNVTNLAGAQRKRKMSAKNPL